ncbi:MAG: iron-sulfur cluster assembly protein [Prevotellaceae bacterium]|jgi:FeS assembly SUF system protein|nr:iron-sulfur cluster assembly protein [Prevotellaceae bacterium]
MIELEKKIITALKTVYDPEIPVNIYDLGLIYEVIVDDDKSVKITMTLTSPHCPLADQLVDDVYNSVKAIDGVSDVTVKLTFEPSWDKSMMTEEAMLELGFL